MLENILVNLVVLTFAAGGLWLWGLGLNSLRVLLLSPFWPRLDVQAHGRVEVSRSKRYIENTRDYRPSGDERISHQALGGGEVTRSSYQPILSLRYQWQGKNYQSDNRAFWNHRSGYTRSEAEKYVAQARKTPISVRINPARPQEVFLGPSHFPWVFTPLWLLIGGLVATGGVGSLLDDLASALKLTLPRIADRSIFIVVVPVLSIIWLLWEILYSCFSRPSAKPGSQTSAGKSGKS